MDVSPRRLFLLLILMLSLLVAAPSYARKHETGFLDRTITVQGTTYKYQVFVPDNWNSHEKWPVILFLHGAGERGDDGLLQTDVGIGPGHSQWTQPDTGDRSDAAMPEESLVAS